MYRYRYFDYTLVTDHRFPELVAASDSDDTSDVMMLSRKSCDEVEGLRNGEVVSSEICHTWQESGMFCRVADGRYQLVFPEMLTVTCDDSGLNLTYCADDQVAQETLRHLLLDQALPRCFSSGGDLILHASAVSLGESTIAFVGASGLGKSTLAGAYFQQGWEILSDDCIKVSKGADKAAEVHGGYQSLRLFDDAARSLLPQVDLQTMRVDESDKYRFSLAEDRANSASSFEHRSTQGAAVNKTISMIVILTAPVDGLKEPLLKPVSGATALFSLLSESFSLDPANKVGVTARVEMISTLLEQTPCVASLTYPRHYECLPEVMALLNNASAKSDQPVTPAALQPTPNA